MGWTWIKWNICIKLYHKIIPAQGMQTNILTTKILNKFHVFYENLCYVEKEDGYSLQE